MVLESISEVGGPCPLIDLFHIRLVLKYFLAHCDGAYYTPDGSEKSLYTLHLYLNEKDEENNLVGGATTFHSYNMEKEFNVYPKIGRVLLFQHENLLHSGQAVDQGIKMTLRTDLMYTELET